MPYLRVYTNANLKDKNAEKFCERASELVAEQLGKPVGYVVVALVKEEAMAFGGGASNKGILAYMDSIGFRDREGLVRLLTEFFCERFEDVELHNINIVTRSLAASDVACAGRFFG